MILSVLWALVATIGLLVNKMLPLGNMTIFYALLAVTIVIDILVVLRVIGYIQEAKAQPKKKH
jgi:hypothetical protein